jgi:AcrR family transcriptional regulator
VARAALAVIDREGPDALSMRRLASELGVGTMTLYGYFRSKADLLDAVVDEAVSDHGPLARTGAWRDQLREVVLEVRRNLLRHPGLARLRLTRPILRPEALRLTEVTMEVLGEAGFDRREAAKALRLLFTYVFGFATLSPEEGTDEARRESRAATARLPAADYPALTAASEELADAMGGEEVFRYGLERILDGLEATLERRHSGRKLPEREARGHPPHHRDHR